MILILESTLMYLHQNGVDINSIISFGEIKETKDKIKYLRISESDYIKMKSYEHTRDQR